MYEVRGEHLVAEVAHHRDPVIAVEARPSVIIPAPEADV
jgi:hypothetical protein